LPLSLALYLSTLLFRQTLPTWPVSGTWFFNPLAWQIVFVLGFSIAREDYGLGAWARRNIFWLRIVSIPIVIAAAFVVWFDLWPDPTSLPHPRLLFINDKTYETPVRLTQFLALVSVFSIAFPYIRWAGTARYSRYVVSPIIGLFAMLGRHSLYVFCVGSLLSLLAQVVRFYYHGSVGSDTAVVILGILIMAFTAWLAESRQRAHPAQPAPAPR